MGESWIPRRFFIRWLAAALLIVHLGASAVASGDPDFSRFSSTLLQLMLPAREDASSTKTQANMDAAVPLFVSALNPGGLWPDITYNDTGDRGEWLAGEHLRRCLILAVSSSPANSLSAFAGDAAVRNATRACTAGWLTLDPQNTNWWWTQFGTPQAVAKLLVLAPSPASLMVAEALVFPRLPLADVAAFSGANRVWGAFIYALVGVASGDASRVDAAAPLLHAAMAPAAPGVDGIQGDGSFHQHGPLAYFSYGYGAHFVGTAFTFEAAASGTRWAMGASAWGNLTRYVLEGARWTLRRCEFNIGLMGRHNTYFGEVDSAGVAKGHYHFFAAYAAFPLAFPPLAPSPGAPGSARAPAPRDPYSSALAAHFTLLLGPFSNRSRGSELDGLRRQCLSNGSTEDVSVEGHSHFFLSDAAAHIRGAAPAAAGAPGFSLTLHLFSNRTLNTECVNGEGLQNRAMADGLLTFQVNGDEYRDVAPAWRWALAPGTTELQTGAPYTCSGAEGAQVTGAGERRAFVGGAGDGWLGVAALDFRRVDGGSALTARKSWHFLEEGAVAVGAGIVSDGRFNVTTAMEQSAPPGARLLVGFANGSQAWCGGFCDGRLLAPDVEFLSWGGARSVFLLPALLPPAGAAGGARLGVDTRPKTGAWADVTQGPATPVSVPMFSAWIHHGPVTAAAPGAYAYAVLSSAAANATAPGSAAAAAAAFRSVTVVTEATPSRHAVCRTAPNRTLAWHVSLVTWPPAEAADAPAGGHSGDGGECPSVTASAPSLALASLSVDGGTLTVTAASPLAAGAPLRVSVAGLRLAGAPTAACLPGAAGGVDVVLETPPTGASVHAACAVAAFF